MLDTLNSSVMHAYQTYRLTSIPDEKDTQRDLLFCDGSMQKYLQCQWEKEDALTKETFLRRANAEY